MVLNEFEQRLVEPFGCLNVKITRGLVCQQDRRLESESSGRGNSLLLPPGQLGWSVVKPFLESDLSQKFPGTFSCLALQGTGDQ